MNQAIDYVFSFAHRETGIFNGTRLTISDPAGIEPNTPPDHIAIAGHHDHQCRRLDIGTGEVVDYRPDQPSADHEWHEPTRRWKLSEAAQTKMVAIAAARARIVALEAASGPLVRRVVIMGDAAALERLKAIEAEIGALESVS